ncbi:DnaJ-like protein subfamily C member 9 [Leptotrombidium deliense]|uniref:DnaJ-like protein subfamily C member 9 n=1 Tax=Leptotrombidium deliense TaxID=299467 RepID=A0A443S6V7_9ACAR|nr:DnaJ-like protein subfamily C member 9 [Leptotrombidium deliense]
MGFSEDCVKYFGTKNLYEILGIQKTANEAAIKKAYRKLSLVCHPDRCEPKNDSDKNEITAKFQVLAKVHFILSDKEKRAEYDETGLIMDDDTFDSEADWDQYWRVLFPKVTTKDINAFYEKYLGSKDEKEDLKRLYVRFEGDMDKLYECMIGFEEERTREMIQSMIENEEIPDFDAFSKETTLKKKKRMKKVEKEQREAAKAQSDESMNDLVNAIQKRRANSFNDIVSQLEAKYANVGKDKKPTPKKNSKKQKRT